MLPTGRSSPANARGSKQDSTIPKFATRAKAPNRALFSRATIRWNVGLSYSFANIVVSVCFPSHALHHLEAVAQVGQRSDVDAPDQWFVRRRASSQLLPGADVALGETR